MKSCRCCWKLRVAREQPDNRKENNDGGQGQNRTVDTRIFSPLLYRLSYLAIVVYYLNRTAKTSLLYYADFQPAFTPLYPRRLVATRPRYLAVF